MQGLFWRFFITATIVAALIAGGIWVANRVSDPQRVASLLAERMGGNLTGNAGLRFWPTPHLTVQNVTFESHNQDIRLTGDRLLVPLNWRDLAVTAPHRVKLVNGTMALNWRQGHEPLAIFEDWKQTELALDNVTLDWTGWSDLPLRFQAKDGLVIQREQRLNLTADNTKGEALAMGLFCEPGVCALNTKLGLGEQEWHIEGILYTEGHYLDATVSGKDVVLPASSLWPSSSPDDIDFQLHADSRGINIRDLHVEWPLAHLMTGNARRVTNTRGIHWDAQLSLSELIVSDSVENQIIFPGNSGSASITTDTLVHGNDRLTDVNVVADWRDDEWTADIQSRLLNNQPIDLTAMFSGSRQTPGISIQSQLRSDITTSHWLLQRLPGFHLLNIPDQVHAWQLDLEAHFDTDAVEWQSITLQTDPYGTLHVDDLVVTAKDAKGTFNLIQWQPFEDLDIEALSLLIQGITSLDIPFSGRTVVSQGAVDWHWNGQDLKLDAIDFTIDDWRVKGDVLWTHNESHDGLAPTAFTLTFDATEKNSSVPLYWLDALTPFGAKPLQEFLGAHVINAQFYRQPMPGETLWGVAVTSPENQFQIDAAWQRNDSLLRVENFEWQKPFSQSSFLLVGGGWDTVEDLKVELPRVTELLMGGAKFGL